MFLLWNRLPWASCYDRYCLYCRGFLTSFGVPFHGKSSFRFRIFYSILTFRGCRMIIPFYFYILLGILILMHSLMLYLKILSIIYCNFTINNHMMSLETQVHQYKNISSRLLSGRVRTSYCVPSFDDNNKLIIPYKYASMHSYSKAQAYISSKIVVYVKPFNNIIVYVKPFKSFKNHSPLMPNITVNLLPTSMELAKSVFYTRSGKWINPYSGACPVNNWIVLDSLNKEHMSIRLTIIKEKKNNVISIMPDADFACRELFHYVFIYMYTKYPNEFFVYQKNNFYYISCYSTNRTYFIKDLATHNTTDLFRILSECVVSDFTIMKKIKGKYVVIASNSLFAINWQVSDRIGYDIVSLHGKAPGWQEGEIYYKQNVANFDRIRSDSIFKRSTLFIVNTPTLNLPIHTVRTPLKHEIGVAVGYRLKDLYLRREFQTFHLLPISGLIVFNVRTFTHSLDTLSCEDLIAIQRRANEWDNYAADYHGRDSWLPVIDKAIYDWNKGIPSEKKKELRIIVCILFLLVFVNPFILYISFVISILDISIHFFL